MLLRALHHSIGDRGDAGGGVYIYKRLIYFILYLVKFRCDKMPQNVAAKLWSFVAWSSVTYIENTGVGDLTLLRYSLS